MGSGAISGGTADPKQLCQNGGADDVCIDAPFAAGHGGGQKAGEEGEGEGVNSEGQVKLQGFLPDRGIEELAGIDAGRGEQGDGCECYEKGKPGEGGGVAPESVGYAGWGKGGHVAAPFTVAGRRKAACIA